MRLRIGVEEICKNCSLIGFTNFGKGFEEICKGYLQFPPELVYLDSVHLTEFYLKVFPFGEPFSRSGNFTKTILFSFSPFGEELFSVRVGNFTTSVLFCYFLHLEKIPFTTSVVTWWQLFRFSPFGETRFFWASPKRGTVYLLMLQQGWCWCFMCYMLCGVCFQYTICCMLFMLCILYIVF